MEVYVGMGALKMTEDFVPIFQSFKGSHPCQGKMYQSPWVLVPTRVASVV